MLELESVLENDKSDAISRAGEEIVPDNEHESHRFLSAFVLKQCDQYHYDGLSMFDHRRSRGSGHSSHTIADRLPRYARVFD